MSEKPLPNNLPCAYCGKSWVEGKSPVHQCDPLDLTMPYGRGTTIHPNRLAAEGLTRPPLPAPAGRPEFWDNDKTAPYRLANLHFVDAASVGIHIAKVQAYADTLEAEKAALENAAWQGHETPCTFGSLCPYCEIDRLQAELSALKLSLEAKGRDADYKKLADAAFALYQACLGEDTGVLGAPSVSVAASKLHALLKDGKNGSA